MKTLRFTNPCTLALASALRTALALPSPMTLMDSSMTSSSSKYELGDQVCEAATSLPFTFTKGGESDGVNVYDSTPIRTRTKSVTSSMRGNTFPKEKMPQGSIEEIQAVTIKKRGAVGQAAGSIVTGLMAVGLLKQLYNAVAPAIQSRLQQAPPSPPPYGYGPQYSWMQMQSRDIHKAEDSSISSQNASEVPEDGILIRRQVMDVASHFVNLGFAVQTVQENVGPITREIIRLEHEALHKAKEWMHPEQQQAYMQKRDDHQYAGEQDLMEERLNRRSMMDTVLDHPATAKVANSANILVTISMLTGLAGRYIDQLIQKAKTIIPGSQKQSPQRANYRYSYR